MDDIQPHSHSMHAGGGMVNVCLMHECPIVRAGLRAILSGQPGLEVSEPAQWPAAGHDGVVIAGYDSGMEAARHAAEQGSRLPRVMVFTSHSREWQVRSAIESGVLGYLLQECEPRELVEGVRALALGRRYLCSAANLSVVNSLGRVPLTRREADVLQVLARGCPDKTIARELGIGLGTVKTHMKQLMQKFDAKGRTQIVLMALERGLLAV